MRESGVPSVIGRTVGSYRILEPLGAGGMGEVYKAHDEKLDRPVAMKLLPRELAADADRLRRFHAEARAVSSLNHPNILVIHDFGDLDGQPFIVSELVEGDTLRQRLDRGALLLDEAVEIAAQIAGALAAAHERGIVHRDVKPENVMLRRDGYVKVLDFGLAKLVDSPQMETAMAPLPTQVGVIVGTIHYMSPEQAEGRDVDMRSDIFSLGVILYELTTGVRPFTGNSDLAVLSSILRDSPKRVTEVNPALPAELGRIVHDCLVKDRDRRYRSAAALRSDLDRLHRSLAAPPAIAPGAPRDDHKSAGIESLAVLPFANASGDPDTEYLSDGITETLINRLSQIPTLRVVPRSTVFRYKGRDIDPHRTGRQLKVRALLTGKVLQRGDALSVQAELVDVRQQAQLWGERLVRRGADIFAVEDEIARQITDALRVRLSGEERERLARRYTDDTEAYRLYLRGRYHWSKRTGPDLRKSLDYFEQAAARDPKFALAYTGVADACVVMSAFEAGPPRDLLARAKAAARRALEIEPDLPEAQAEMCLIWPALDRDWDAADDAYRSGVKRQPSYWLLHDHYAMTLAARGRLDEAVAEVRRGQALEPLSLVVHHHVAFMLVQARRPDEAIAECRTALDMDPTFANAHFWMGLALEQKGLYDDAAVSFEQAIAHMGPRSLSIAAAAHAHALAGRPEEAGRRLAELTAASAERFVEPYALALLHTALGDPQSAIDWLERADEARSPWLMLFGNTDSRLDGLRREPRFAELLRRLGVRPA